MSRFSRLDVLNEVLSSGLVPLFDHQDRQVAKEVIRACADGGARVVEFRNRGSGALWIFSDLAEWSNREEPSIILGVGSVVDAATAGIYLACGANFVVSPVLNHEIARVCNRQKVAYMPGCGSVSEISEAEELGAEICKVFPGAQVGGPSFVRSVLAPCPWSRLMPTGGVDATEESVTAWVEAGAACLGMGSKLITTEIMQQGDYRTLTTNVQQVLSWIQSARRASSVNGGHRDSATLSVGARKGAENPTGLGKRTLGDAISGE